MKLINNFPEKSAHLINLEQLRGIYIKIAFITIIFGICAVSLGLLLDHVFDRYPICTITVIIVSFLTLTIINLQILKKSIQDNVDLTNKIN